MPAYSEAVKSGLYAKHSGLVGKYDNVRLLWEDEITRHFLRPHLAKVIDRCQAAMRRVRILDLGCGSADGFELLGGVRHRDADLEDVEIDLLTPDVLGLYRGIDLNEDLLEQARGIYGTTPKVVFKQGDFTKGLPLEPDEEPYDLYFTSFGTCSHHNNDATIIAMLADIAERTRDYAVVSCDWLGRFSYEWQDLWTSDYDSLQNMDYVVSYIYEKEEREAKRDQLQHLLLRLMSRQEAEAIVAAASDRAGVPIRAVSWYDRSVFTGRHMDTAEYNAFAQPVRNAVNSLHEVNQRTDLTSLLVDYTPKDGFPLLNSYYERLQLCWNLLVKYAGELLASFNEGTRQFERALPDPPVGAPDCLCQMMGRMRQVVEGTGWFGMGLPRENIVEPQLGYALRHVVMQLQEGQGCGHGLIGILEIDRRS